MQQVPVLYKVENIVAHANEVQAEVNGRYVPVRGLGLQSFSIGRRLKIAWGVFTGKYDAVEWEA